MSGPYGRPEIPPIEGNSGYIPKNTNNINNLTKENVLNNESSRTTIDSVRIFENEYKSVAIYSTSTYEFGVRIHIKNRVPGTLQTILGVQFYLKNPVTNIEKDRLCQVGLLGLGIVQWLAPTDGTSSTEAPSFKVNYSTRIDTTKTSDEVIPKDHNGITGTLVQGNNIRINNFGIKISSVEIDKHYYYTFNREKVQQIIHVDSWLNNEKYLTSNEQEIIVNHGTNGKKTLTIRLDSLKISPYLDGNWNIRDREDSRIENRGNGYYRIIWSRGELLYQDEDLNTSKSISFILPDFDVNVSKSIDWSLNLTDRAAEIAYDYEDPITKRNPITKDVLEVTANHSLGYSVYVLPIIICGSNRYNVRAYVNNTFNDIIEYPSGIETTYTLRPDQSMLTEFTNVKTKNVTLLLYHYNSNAIKKDTIFKYKDDDALRSLNGFIGTASDTFDLTIPYDDRPTILDSTAMLSTRKQGSSTMDTNVIRNKRKHVYSITDYITEWSEPATTNITKAESIQYTPVSTSIVNAKALPESDFRKYALITGKSRIGVEAQFTSVNSKYIDKDFTKITKIELKANDNIFKIAEFVNDMNGTDFCIESVPFTKCAPIAISLHNGRNDNIEEVIGSGTSTYAGRTGSGSYPWNHLISMFNYDPPTAQLDVDLRTVIRGGQNTLMPLVKLSITHSSICDPYRYVSGLLYDESSDEYATAHTDFGEVTYKLYYKLIYSDGSDSGYNLTNIQGTTKNVLYDTIKAYNIQCVDNIGFDDDIEILRQIGSSTTNINFGKDNDRDPVQIEFILIWHDSFVSRSLTNSYPVCINNTAQQQEQLTTLNPTEVFIDVDVEHMGIGVGDNYDYTVGSNIKNGLSVSNIDDTPLTSFKNVIVNWDSVFMRNTYFKYAAYFYDGININLGTANNGNNNSVVYNTETGRLEYLASSRRYKEDINYDIDMESYHKQFEKIKVVKFNYKQKGDNNIEENSIEHTPHNLGFIAEDLDEINKDLVVYNKEEIPENYKDRDMLALLYIEVKRQNEKIKELETEIAELKAK